MNDDVLPVPEAYPARFPLKVIGRAEDNFIDRVTAVIERHAASWEPTSLRTNHSRDHRYISITAIVTIADKWQMESMCHAIKAIPEVLMCL